MKPGNKGFALLAVLWVTVGLSILGSGSLLAAKRAIHAARNRTNLTRSAWIAEGCAARVQAAAARIDFNADVGTARTRLSPWADFGRVVVSSSELVSSGCDIELVPAGVAVDVNAATPSQLRRLFVAMQTGRVAADSLVDAIVDWRDEDDTPGRYGAERDWYESRGLFVPRNGPFAHRSEMSRVRGLKSVAGADRALDVEPGRISLQHALAHVLASLPGFTREIISLVTARQSSRRPVGSLLEIAGAVSAVSSDSIMAHYSELATTVTEKPDAWILKAHGESGQPAVRATVELRLARAGSRVAVVRRRSW